MNKCMWVLIFSFSLISCTVKDEHYYRTHPQALHDAIKECPSHPAEGLSCEQLLDMGKEFSGLAYQLQSNPQGFGARILALQQTIANQKQDLSKTASNTELKVSLEKNQKELVNLLTIVNWLESPES